MTKIRNIRQGIMILTLAVMASCEYKDIEEFYFPEKMNLTIHYDWQKVDSVPKNIRVAFYPENYEAYARGYTFFDVMNRDTTIQIVGGKYNMTYWNIDTEYVITDGYSKQSTAYVTTGDYSPHGSVTVPHVLDSIYNYQRVLDYPDYMIHGNLSDLFIKNDTTVTLTPDSMVVTVDVILHGIKGQQYVKNIRGAINNVAGKRLMAYENTTTDKVGIIYEGKTSPEDSCLKARFYIFGIEPTEASKQHHKVVFFVWLTGGQVYIPVDVTDIVAHYTRDDKYILIETEDLDIDLEKYIQGGKMSVDAEDWISTDEVILSF